jgi:hypothetical protein
LNDGTARTITSVSIALFILASPGVTAAQVLRDPPTPYHFLRYDEVPGDQDSPDWPNDFWSRSI